MPVRLHRWAGLVAGWYLALLGLSGSALVLAPYFHHWAFGVPAIPDERRDAAYASPDVWLRKAEAKYGAIAGVEGYFGPLANPLRVGAPTITFTIERDGVPATGVIVVEPYSGEPIARFIADESWTTLPLWLHMSLFLPYPAFLTLLASLAFLLVGMLATGLWSWWPAPGRWREALRPRSPRSPGALRALHGALGAWASPWLLVAALSGLLMAKPTVGDALASMLGRPLHDTVAAPATCPGRSAVTPGEALAATRALLPGHELATLTPPTDAADHYTVTLRPRGEFDAVRGTARFHVGAVCGEIRNASATGRPGIGEILRDRAVDAHTGRWLGQPGEWSMFGAGLALAGLPVAGVVLWRWRRRGSVPPRAG